LSELRGAAVHAFNSDSELVDIGLDHFGHDIAFASLPSSDRREALTRTAFSAQYAHTRARREKSEQRVFRPNTRARERSRLSGE
jgi:hypothetical protein